MVDSETVRQDFDRIAPLVSDGPGPYDDHVLSQVPSPCARALDVGCGTGHFARRLAARCDQVLAIDLSPNMIEVAQRRALPNLEFRVADVLREELPRELDLVVSITALHHLPFEETLQKLAAALRPGGRLVVHDIVDNSSWIGQLAQTANRLVQRAPAHPELRAAWEAHDEHDCFLPMAEVRRRARGILPGVRIRRHLRWRYTLVYEKSL
jgi:SAM-dependent methyltransferase